MHDAVVVGGGLVGLATAAALSERGARVLLLYDNRRGEASPAAAGMLAPSVEVHQGAAHRFAVAARDRYPSYVDELKARTGLEVPLNRLGVLELALAESELDAPPFTAPAAGTARLSAAQLHALEPALAHAHGALFHPSDGAVNNLVLLRALKALVGRDDRVTVVADAAVAVEPEGAGAAVDTISGERYRATAVVLAAGAWVAGLGGLPRALPVVPVRGQLLSLAGAPLRHVTYGAGGYAVPRGDGRTIIGSTMERVGFDADTTERGLAQVRATGAAICPALADRRMLNGWSGLRPVTPAFLPILGRDPEFPALVYACGHSRNGVLLAPLSGEVVADLVVERTPAHDISAFRIERFGD